MKPSFKIFLQSVYGRDMMLLLPVWTEPVKKSVKKIFVMSIQSQ